MTYTLAVLLITCIPISIVDCRKCIIPDALLLLLFLLLGIHDVLSVKIRIVPAALTAAASFCMFLSIYRLHGGLGFGDVKFSAVLGYALGFPLAFLAFTVASIIGILYAAVFLRNKKRNFKIPFAPFLSAGAVLAAIFVSMGLISTGY